MRRVSRSSAMTSEIMPQRTQLDIPSQCHAIELVVPSIAVAEAGVHEAQRRATAAGLKGDLERQLHRRLRAERLAVGVERAGKAIEHPQSPRRLEIGDGH